MALSKAQSSHSSNAPVIQYWHVVLDDVGEFGLWVVSDPLQIDTVALTAAGVMPSEVTAAQLGSDSNVLAELAFHENLQRGVIWNAQVNGRELEFEPSEVSEFDWHGIQVRSEHPSPASPCMLWKPLGEREAKGAGLGAALAWPESGWLFLPLGKELAFGPRAGAMHAEGWQHSVILRATKQGLQIACAGGIRGEMESGSQGSSGSLGSSGSGEFDEPRPQQIHSGPTGRSRQYWCKARPGPPVFITLEPRGAFHS